MVLRNILNIKKKKASFLYQYSVILGQERVLSVKMAPVFFFYAQRDSDISKVSIPIMERSLRQAFYSYNT